MHIPFQHQQHAHCESGVTVNLLRYEGIPISEPMAFGLGSGLYFVHLPFIKVNGKPAIGYRQWFVSIFKKSIRRLGGSIALKTFSREQEGMAALDKLLEQGKPVAVVTNVYYLDYLPEYFRFQFSGHNLVVYGKQDGQYMISDPVIEEMSWISADQLRQARFAQATPRPKGKMYYIENAGSLNGDLSLSIWQSIDQVCYNMTVPPMPWFGTNGILLLARKLRKYPKKYDTTTINLYLSNIIQMQEVIGTGGAGFRFLYAAFLQEAGQLTNNPDLPRMAQKLTAIGDDWRNFALAAGKIMKGRNMASDRFDKLGDLLQHVGVQEKSFFKELRALNPYKRTGKVAK